MFQRVLLDDVDENTDINDSAIIKNTINNTKQHCSHWCQCQSPGVCKSGSNNRERTITQREGRWAFNNRERKPQQNSCMTAHDLNMEALEKLSKIYDSIENEPHLWLVLGVCSSTDKGSAHRYTVTIFYAQIHIVVPLFMQTCSQM